MSAEHILVVDDDPETLTLVSLVLERQGYRVSRASSAQIAVEQIAADPPDLIILDVMMPEVDGFSLARYLRTDAAMARIPIVMFTAKSLVDDRVTGYEAGVDDYITKPAHPAELLARVKSVLARVAAQPRTGQVVACLGASPGAGVSTVVINSALALAQGGTVVIVAELGPTPSALRCLEDVGPGRGLPEVLEQLLDSPHNVGVSATLIPFAESTYLLPGVETLAQDVRLTPELADWLVGALAALGGFILLDLGSRFDLRSRQQAARADYLLIVTEPVRDSMLAAHERIRLLKSDGLDASRIGVIVANHQVPEPHYDYQAVCSGLGVDYLAVLPAEPRALEEAAATGKPLLLHRPDSHLAEHFRRLAGELRGQLRLAPRSARTRGPRPL